LSELSTPKCHNFGALNHANVPKLTLLEGGHRYLIDTVKVAVELKEERRGFVGREEIQRVVRLVMHQAECHAFRTRAAELKQLAAKYTYCNTHLDLFLDGLIL